MFAHKCRLILSDDGKYNFQIMAKEAPILFRKLCKKQFLTQDHVEIICDGKSSVKSESWKTYDSKDLHENSSDLHVQCHRWSNGRFGIFTYFQMRDFQDFL